MKITDNFNYTAKQMSILDTCISFNCALLSVLCFIIYQREVLAVDLIQFRGLLDVVWIGSFGMPSHHYPPDMKSASSIRY
jgi:hypothetical protein